MAELYKNLVNSFNDPMMGMAIGLLGGADPGGTVAGGLQQGLTNMQAMGQLQHRQDLATRMMVQRTEELRRRRALDEMARQRSLAISQRYGTPEGITPPSKMLQADAMGLQPGTPAYAEFMQPAPNVVINQGGAGGGPTVLTDEQLQSAGLSPGTVAQVDNKGKINIVQSPEKENAAYAKVDQVNDAVSTYESVLSRTGPEVIPGDDKLELGAAYNNLMLEAKELYNLGVLNGPDLAIMSEVLKNPTEVTSQIYSTEALKRQLDVFKDKITEARARLDRQYGKKSTGTPQPPPGFTEVIE